MGSSMDFKVGRVSKICFANITLKWFLISMGSDMYCQSAAGGTYSTFERFITRIHSSMYFKVVRLGKSSDAKITFIWFLTSMNSSMYFKARKVGKSCFANIALKWFLTSMGCDMNCLYIFGSKT